MRLHSGTKPYQCDRCTCKFTQFVHLKLHKRLHTNERPFICGTCSKSYISASGLRTHWKTTATCTPTPAEMAFTAEKPAYQGIPEARPGLEGEKGEREVLPYCTAKFALKSNLCLRPEHLSEVLLYVRTIIHRQLDAKFLLGFLSLRRARRGGGG